MTVLKIQRKDRRSLSQKNKLSLIENMSLIYYYYRSYIFLMKHFVVFIDEKQDAKAFIDQINKMDDFTEEFDIVFASSEIWEAK